MSIAEVVLDIPTQALDAPFSYAIPSELGNVEVGCAVVCPLGSRRVIGFVLEIADVAPDRDLKPILEVVSKPYFNSDGAECARYLAKRYVAPLSVCVRLFTPPGGIPKVIRGQNGAWSVVQPKIKEVDDRWVVAGPNIDSVDLRRNAVKQRAILNAVRNGDVRMSELTLEFGNVSGAVRALCDRGAVVIERKRRNRSNFSAGAGGSSRQTYSRPDELTESQSSALAAVSEAVDASCGRVVVIDGVTGSGKTEVYLQAIEKVIAYGKNAIVLVPEISLTPQTAARFRSRFGDMVAVMHSRMSQGERYDQWDAVRTGGIRVVVGARSALFTPLQNIGLIVIDEEHETSYKQESAPRYVARDVAEWMMRRASGTLVLGSATPSIDSLYRAKTDKNWSLVEMPTRANGRPLPSIEVVDMAKEFSGGNRSMFSRRLKKALRDELGAGRKAVLLLNQRGFANFLLCRDCGYVPECVNCSTSLTYHERGSKLVCHHCGYTTAVPTVCPNCGSPYLKRFGAGTQRVEDELRGFLDAEMGETETPVPVIRMDADTTSTKGAHQKLLETFAAAPPAVLLGTQMIAKGLDFDDVTVVGVINADTQLHLPDYRASERTFDLIEQVAGRAGRGSLPGHVIVQTYNPESSAIRYASAYDRNAFLQEELAKRKAFDYPPYTRMANVLVWGKKESEVESYAKKLYSSIVSDMSQEQKMDWTVYEASPCLLSRVRGNFRWHILIKADLESCFDEVLGRVFNERKANNSVNSAVDVDPYNLL